MKVSNMNVSMNNISIGSPRNLDPPEPISFEAMTLCVDELLSHVRDERKERIFRLRHGLEDGQVLTLEEVGRDLGITRERVRQIQVQTQRKLVQVARRSRPEFLTNCEMYLKDFGDRVGADMSDSKFTQALSAFVGEDLAIVAAQLSVFLLIFDGTRTDRTSLDELDSSVFQTLVENLGDVTFDEITNAIQSNPEIDDALQDWPKFNPLMRIELLFGVNIDEDGLHVAPEQILSQLSSRERRLFALTHVLKKAGKPLHFSEIASFVEPLLPGTFAMTKRNVLAWLDRYKDRFKWVGSGIYGLTDWDIGVRDGSLDNSLQPARRIGIGDEVALLLSERGKPIFLEDIEDHILGRFEVNRASVVAAIIQDKAHRFELLEDGTVVLAMWRGRKDSNSSIEDPVVAMIPSLKRRVRLSGELRDKARAAARRRAFEVYSLLNRGTIGVSTSKASGFAVVSGVLGMTNEFEVLIGIAEQGGMPHSMSEALKDIST